MQTQCSSGVLCGFGLVLLVPGSWLTHNTVDDTAAQQLGYDIGWPYHGIVKMP